MGGQSSSASPLLAPRQQDRPLEGPRGHSSQLKTISNVFIAVVGAGVLGLPYTFSRTGLAAGLLALAAVAALTAYCMNLLVVSRRLYSKAHITSFGQLGNATVGTVGQTAVDIMIILSQVGFCVGYIIFIADTYSHLFPGAASTWLPKPLFLLALLPLQLALNSIKSLTHLAPISLIADLFCLGAMFVVLIVDTETWAENHPGIFMVGDFSKILYGVGVAVYAFEGIGMVLPLELEASDREKYPATIWLSMILIAIIYGLFGAMGYLAFGDGTQPIVTNNLSRGWIAAIVQIGLAINLYFTMPVMLQPVFEIMERNFFGCRYCGWMRWLTVVSVGLIVLLVPNFTDFLSLVGSSVCVVLGFVFPAWFHLRAHQDVATHKQLSMAETGIDVAIMVFGGLLSVSGTWSSIMHMISPTG